MKVTDYTTKKGDTVDVEFNPATGGFLATLSGRAYAAETLEELRRKLEAASRVRRTRVSITVGADDGSNLTLTGLHANETDVLARGSDNQPFKPDSWKTPYLPWNADATAKLRELRRACVNADEALTAFKMSRVLRLKGETATRFTNRSLVIRAIKAQEDGVILVAEEQL